MTGRRRRRLAIWALLLAALAAAAIFIAPGLLRRWQYPMRMTPLIERLGEKYDLPRELLSAVICVESRFNERAVSSAGALGLMQIMPSTGEWIAGRLGEAGFEREWLFEPARNAEYGSWYLRFLLDRYEGHISSAVAAYHAGQGSVDGWLADPSLSPDGKALSRAGSQATRHYVDKVLTAYENYQILYTGR